MLSSSCVQGRGHLDSVLTCAVCSLNECTHVTPGNSVALLPHSCSWHGHVFAAKLPCQVRPILEKLLSFEKFCSGTGPALPQPKPSTVGVDPAVDTDTLPNKASSVSAGTTAITGNAASSPPAWPPQTLASWPCRPALPPWCQAGQGQSAGQAGRDRHAAWAPGQSKVALVMRLM